MDEKGRDREGQVHISGDMVGGDKIDGDKVMGHKTVDNRWGMFLDKIRIPLTVVIALLVLFAVPGIITAIGSTGGVIEALQNAGILPFPTATAAIPAPTSTSIPRPPSPTVEPLLFPIEQLDETLRGCLKIALPLPKAMSVL